MALEQFVAPRSALLLCPGISGAQIEALVSGWLKPIFFRFPVGFDVVLVLL